MEEELGLNDQQRYEEYERVKRRFSLKKHGALTGFRNAEEFANWWLKKFIEQDCCCAYCKTSIFLIRQLIDRGVLRTRKVAGNGYRGYNFELDRKDPDGGYSPHNCVLVCYYCNNDKSYIYTADQYEAFFGAARHRHFKFLLAKKDSG